MASNSDRNSGSSGRSAKRRRVVITAQQTSNVGKGKTQRGVKGNSARRKPVSTEVSDAARRRSKSLRDQREARLRQQRLKVKLKLMGIAALVTLVVVAVVGVYQSSVFTIVRVDVLGSAHLTPDEVRALAALPEGATLLRFPGAAIKQRLEANPWISSANVSRDFPDGLRIRVTERVPVARIDGGEKFWLVDRAGWIIAEQTTEATSALVVVRDLADVAPVVGERSSSETLMNALDVWSGLSDELKSRTRLISAPSMDKTAIVTTDDIEVFIGSAEDIGKKDVVIRRILAEQAGKVVYINVRSVDRPTWRGINAP